MFKNTTLGKGLKTLVWLVLANAVVFVATQVTSHPDLYNPAIVSAANVLGVVVKNLFDSTVKNV